MTISSIKLALGGVTTATALTLGLTGCGDKVTLEEKNSRILSELAERGDANIPYYFESGINSYVNISKFDRSTTDKYFVAYDDVKLKTKNLIYKAFDEGVKDAEIEESQNANKERRLINIAKEVEGVNPKTAAEYKDYFGERLNEKVRRIEEAKMLDIIKTTRAKHPELKGAKLDSAISFEVAIAKKMELLKKQERQSNYLISFYNKGMQSIKDSLSGKNLKPFNVIKTPNLGENLKMQAFHLGQQRIRMSLDSAKVKRMLKQCAR